MNYPDQRGAPRRPSLFPLLIVGFMLFMLFTWWSGRQGARDLPGPASQPEIIQGNDQGAGDWTVDDIRGVGAANKPPTPAASSREETDSGDWSIEEVPTTSASRGDFSDPQDRRPSETKSGDWSIEVGDSQRSGGSKPTKTTKGDWEIEEVKQ